MKIQLFRSLFKDILYVNGNKVFDKDGETRVEDILIALTLPYSRKFVEDSEMEKIGKFPKDLNDLKL